MKTKELQVATRNGSTNINIGTTTNENITNASPLLSLPPELRLTIYNHILPTQNYLYFNHCTHLSKSRIPPHTNSPLTSHLTTHRILTTWFRNHGLHLPQTCHQLRREYTDILRRRGISVVACCVACLERVVAWCKRVHGGWIRGCLRGWWVRVGNGQDRGGELVDGMRRVYRRWFGEVGSVVGIGLDDILGGVDSRGKDRRDARDRAENRWGVVFEYVKVIGRVPGRTRKRRWVASGGSVEENSTVNGGDEDVELGEMGNGNQDEGGDDDAEDNDDTDIALANTFPNATNTTPFPAPHHPHTNQHPHPRHSRSPPYFHNPTTIELSRLTQRYRMDRPGHTSNTILSRMSLVQTVSMEEDGNEQQHDVSGWWRERDKRRVGGFWAWEGGVRRGEVVREEVWVGCCFW